MTSTLGVVDDGVQLSASQRAAVDLCIDAARQKRGRFINIEGKAGTGKSTVLRELRKHMRLVVCAPTGLAAVNVRGETIHRLFGFGIGPKQRSAVRAASKKDVLINCDMIAIDEKSMVRADLMDAIDVCLQKTLDRREPFGGKPVVAFGDMFQLEPVLSDSESEWFNRHYKSTFWFDAKVFNSQPNLIDDAPSCPIETVELEEVFRQQGDPGFIDALNAVRIGDPGGLAMINSRAHVRPEGSPVVITFTNKQAEMMNAQRLDRLDAEPCVFEAQVDGDFPAKDEPAPRTLILKVGAQVMFTRNIAGDFGVVSNGSVGIVVGILRGHPVVELASGEVMLVEPAIWDKIGYAYDPKTDKLTEDVEGTFSQYPLKLAWAITAHKSQGQTLDAAVLELERQAFAHGQLYVGLSRVRSLDGLYLRRRLTPGDLCIHPRVREFFASTRPANRSAFSGSKAA